MAKTDSREIPAGDDKGCRGSGRGLVWGRGRGESRAPSLFDGLAQTFGNFTRCLFDHGFRMLVSYLKPQGSGEESEERALSFPQQYLSCSS